MDGQARDRRISWALLAAGIASFAQLYAPQGVLPRIAAELHIDAAGAALMISSATIGLAVSVLPWSWAADRFGRLAMMRVSLCTATIAGLAVALLPTFPLLMLARCVEGVALGGIVSIAMTYLTEQVTASRIAATAGSYVAGTSLGGLLGRIVAVPIAEATNWRIGIGVVTGFSLACVLAFLVLAPPEQRTRRARGLPFSSLLPAVRVHLRDAGMWMLFAQGFLLMGGFVSVYNYLAFRLEAPPFLLSSGFVALLFLAYLAGTVGARASATLIGRFGRARALLSAQLTMAVGVVLTVSQQVPVIIVGLVILTGGFFTAHAVASSWASLRGRAARSQAASIYNLSYYLGSSVLGWLSGLAFGAFAWPGVAAIVMLLIAVAGTLTLRDRARKPSSDE